MKWSVGTKIGAGIALALVILVIIGMVSYRSTNSLIETADWVNQTYEVLQKAEQVIGSLRDAETGQRGYVITGEERYLEPYYDSLKVIDQQLNDLRTKTGDNPNQQQRINALESLVRERISVLKEVMDIRKDQGFESAQKAMLTDKGKKLMDGIRNLIAEMKSEEDSLLTKRDVEKKDAAQQTISVVIIGIPIAFLLLAAVGFVITRNIANPLKQISNVAERIAVGDLSTNVTPTNRQDEVGVLTKTFDRMTNSLKEMSAVAEQIATGNLAVEVTPQSEKDVLGNSIGRMVENLRKLSQENETRTWLLTGASELNDKMRGEMEVTNLAQEVVVQLTTYLKAHIGSIYIAENGELSLSGSYAFHRRKENTNVIKFGQGLVGQSALENKPIVFSQIPDDYIRINSGLGNSPPKNIIVYPFSYEDQVKGVIEIGSVNEFSDLDMQFLNLIAGNVGIAFNAAQARTRMKELLEETQRQAEELESQQEELRQSNEELLEKTRLLENSEAELKTQQEELQQTNEELEEKANLLEEQKETLEVAKMDVETKARELEITSRYKSEFLANMSHELRTPLNSILILAQLMAENKKKTLGEKEVEFARNIYNSGTDLLNLINEILDLSKVEAGKIELEIAETNIETIPDGLRSMFSEIAKNKSITFETNYQKEQIEGLLHTDGQRLEQILRNLLSNAFKFTGVGGAVTLDIKMLSSEVDFRNRRLSNIDDIVAFSVTDTGIGIPENKQGFVFEAFQQADGSTKRKYGGTGLGLTISRQLAEALGGEIHLQSEEGKGSTFTLYIPLDFDPSLSVSTDKTVEIKKRAKKIDDINIPLPAEDADDDRYTVQENDKVVLILEDDSSFAKILLDFIRERGYKGILAYQGNTGLSLARSYKPDAIILDMKLPIMDGSEVLKQLKNDPELRHIPVQIISGYDRRKEGMDLGAFDFTKKPLTRRDLQTVFDRIEEFVSKKSKKLLVVEDNKQQNKAIKELIGNGDVKSYSAYTGTEAFEIMMAEKFDCVIIDLGLPDMTGFDLLEKIKGNNHLNKIPIIVYTGKDLTKEEAVRLNKLADTVVLKTADSRERLLDETILFLHRVESRLPKEKQQIIRKLHRTDEVLKNKKVLVVDDDMRNIYSLANALEEEGLKCITAENGVSALKALKEQPDIDLILMDVMMPEMDGYEATREIRKTNKFDKLPIIALTAKAMKGDREKCLSVGMSDYISKPVNIEQLLSLLRVWLYS